MHELDVLLAREPTSATWSALVTWFDARLALSLPLAEPFARAQARLAAWPVTVARPLPYHWIFRLCDAAAFPPASLANALCLGDRWALHPDVSIDFENLSPRRLARLAGAPELTGLRWLDVSWQTDGHAHSPGTMLYHVESLPEFLAAPIFAGLVGLDLAFAGVDVAGIAEILAQHPALRVLSLGAGDDDCLGDDDLPQLLEIPGLARLEHLELHRIGAHADATRALLDCPLLAGLRFLGWSVERAWLSECGLRPDEFAALLAAAPLAPEVKTWIGEQYAEGRGFVVEAEYFAAMFPGEPGAPFDMLNDDDDE